MKFKHYRTTGKMSSVKEYRHPENGAFVECLDQSGEWFASAHTLTSLKKYVQYGFMEAVRG